MSAQRIKEYLMQALPDSVGGDKRFRAYFIGDGYSISAFNDILPAVIETGGIKVSCGVATDLIKSFLKSCVNHTATTGETVNIADLMTVTLAIKGSYERRKSSASKDNVRVVARLLNEMRPTVSFSMSNALAGKVVTLQSVTSPGCEPGFVKQGSVATLNGLNMEMLTGDSMIATMKNAAKEDVSIQCAYESAGSTRLDVTIPAEFNDPFYVGNEITFKIINRCGDPDSEQDSDTIKATMLAGDGDEPEPTGPTLTGVHAPGIESPMIHLESGIWFDGTNLDGWSTGRDRIEGKNNRAEEAEFVRLDGEGTEVAFNGGMLKMDEGAWSVLNELGIVEGSEVRFKVTIAGQSAEIVATVAEA